MRNLLQDIGRSATSEQLHEACLLWFMQSRNPVVPERAPWLFFHLPEGVDLQYFALGFDIPGRLEWPGCEVMGLNVFRPDGSPDGSLYLAWMKDGSDFDPYFLWSVAVFSERPAIHGTAGWGAPAVVIPSSWDPSREVTLTPDAIRRELGRVVTTDSFDFCDQYLIQQARPTVHPGFSNLEDEGELAGVVRNLEHLLLAAF